MAATMYPGGDHMNSIRRIMQNISRRYTHFIETKGLGIVVAACVAVIVGTAVWTHDQLPADPLPPAFPTEESLSAAELMQQSLASAVKETQQPSNMQQLFDPPLSTVCVITEFDATRLQPSGVSGVWRLHDAVDLAADVGEIVVAMADGYVLDTGKESVLGAYITIDHGSGIEAVYGGLAGLAGLHAGDPVRAGQTIGFAGNSVLDETDLPAHLHLRVTRDAQSIDPIMLFDP